MGQCGLSTRAISESSGNSSYHLWDTVPRRPLFGSSNGTVVTAPAFEAALYGSNFTDPTEGYAALLRLVFDELAVDLPGLFGDVRLTSLVPVPAKTLRAVVEALDLNEGQRDLVLGGNALRLLRED